MQPLPGAFCFFTKKYDVILTLVEIKTESRFNVTLAGAIVSGGYVIDVDEQRSALRMGEPNKFHLIYLKQAFH